MCMDERLFKQFRTFQCRAITISFWKLPSAFGNYHWLWEITISLRVGGLVITGTIISYCKLPSACHFLSHRLAAKAVTCNTNVQWMHTCHSDVYKPQTPGCVFNICNLWTAKIIPCPDRRLPCWMLATGAVGNCRPPVTVMTNWIYESICPSAGLTTLCGLPWESILANILQRMATSLRQK